MSNTNDDPDVEDTVAKVTGPTTPADEQVFPAPSTEQRKADAAKREADKAAAKPDDADKAAVPEQPAEDKEDAPLDTTVWGDTGDDIANSVLSTLQNSGVSTDMAKSLLWDAVASGDATKVDRDKLVEKVGKAKATLIMAGVENVISRNNAKLEEVVGIVHTAAGSEENWAKTTAWARANMPMAEQDEFRELLEKGGQSAKFAATQLVERYNTDPKNTALSAGKAQLVPDTAGGQGVKGITRREYGDALLKLQRRGATEAEYQALVVSRRAGIKQGL